MKRPNHYLRYFLCISFLAVTAMNAQVGIGTTNPKGALDISSATGGLVIPRNNLLSINDITTVTSSLLFGPVPGTIIYNEGLNIAAGFYLFNGTIWQNLEDTDTYLGTTDQALTGNREINLYNYSLDFNVANNGSNAITLDTDYLAFSRDRGNSQDALLSSRNGMAFNIDSSNNNSNDNQYFSWGQDGALGQGTNDGNYDELMRLNSTGLGIGTDPDYALHVVETTANVNIAKFESPEFPMFAGFIIEDTGGNNTARFAITPGNIANNSSGALTGVNASNTNGRNSVTFDVEGSTYDVYAFMEGEVRPGFDNLTSLGAPNHRFTNIYLVNPPIVTSDIRLKDNIAETNYGLDTVMQITPVSYQLISDEENKTHLGFKAQEIKELIPEIVNTAEVSGMLSMAYTEMIPVLTKAIQELNDKLDNVIRENESLRAQNEAIVNKIARRE